MSIMSIPTEAVQEQYERFPFPPLEIGALSEVRPLPSDAHFAFWYLLRRPPPRSLRILDAGCGTGFSTLKLAEANPDAEIVAVDFSGPSLAIAQQRLKEAGQWSSRVQLRQADLQALPDLGQFDYIHSSGVLHHLPDPLAGMRALQRSLKPQGLAYFMVYSAQARHQLQQIQETLYTLWQDPSNWQEGLKLCRSFFASLAKSHPFKRFYRETHDTITRMLGPGVADSDAFLVDTYLQRCEHLWTQSQYFEQLQQSGWQAARWLDETAWQLENYLPACQSWWQALSLEAQWDLADRLRPAHNFALYLCHQDFAYTPSPPPALEPTARPWAFASAQVRQQNGQDLLDNGRGQALTLTPATRLCWELLLQQSSATPLSRHPWTEIWHKVQERFPQFEAHQLQHFCQLLLQTESVAQYQDHLKQKALN